MKRLLPLWISFHVATKPAKDVRKTTGVGVAGKPYSIFLLEDFFYRTVYVILSFRSYTFWQRYVNKPLHIPLHLAFGFGGDLCPMNITRFNFSEGLVGIFSLEETLKITWWQRIKRDL